MILCIASSGSVALHLPQMFRAMTGSCRATEVLLMTGTTLHAQAGCGIINMWNDFGKMWRKPAIEKWRAIKVLPSWCMPCKNLSNVRVRDYEN